VSQHSDALPHGKRWALSSVRVLLAELRRQRTPAGRAKQRERTRVEHGLAHVGHWSVPPGNRAARPDSRDCRRLPGPT
jgi:hypothetical protein